jgi:ATP-dependent Clp protease adaptor protein ClpS
MPRDASGADGFVVVPGLDWMRAPGGRNRCNEAIAKPRFPIRAGDCILRALRIGMGCRRMNDAVTKPKTKVRTKVERPRLHKVILLNDDFTPREFVTMVLKAEFRMTEDQAHKVMITAHRLGACVVAVFTKDVAETKATRATDAGRAKGYPLLFTTEPEE